MTTDPKEREEAMIQEAYAKMLASIRPKMDANDRAAIQKAFELAKEAHKEQRRKSGEPYILHPIAVAQITAEELELGPTAVIAALLHDVVEDTPVTLDEIRKEFGDKIATIVDGLTKLDADKTMESPQAENFRKVLRTLLVDVRVVLIKIADRLHNMRTLGAMPIHKQQKIAAETKYIYIPLAHRLGIYNIKSQLEDLWLKITNREVYNEISRKLNETKRDRNDYITQFIEPLEKAIKKQLDVPFQIIGRPKSIFSIHNKILSKNVPFEEIYDLFAIRIIVDVPVEKEKLTCWQVYSIVTELFKPIPDRFKDWITIPKSNGYESLHTTVIGPSGRYVEVQIRSVRMNDIAEKGFAAHWKYKGVKASADDVYDKWIETVRETIETSPNALEFLADFKSSLFAEEVHVFTPKGDMKVLPMGATALDFAFAIHSDIGLTCATIKVNNKLVPFSYLLKNGDQVSVTTSKNRRPNEDWLSFVVTGKAKTRIRAALREEKSKQAEFGKEALIRKLNHLKLELEDNVDNLVKFYGFENRMDFYFAISQDRIDLTELKQFPIENNQLILKVKSKESQEKPNLPKREFGSIYSKDIIINGQAADNFAYSLAKCCNPVLGDDIFAYVSANGMKIHRASCPNAENLLASQANNIYKAEWAKTSSGSYYTDLLITGVDKGVGVIEAISSTISSTLGLNIRSFSIDGKDGIFEGRVRLAVNNNNQLNKAINALKKIDGIKNVIRET